MNAGICYVAYGEKARAECARSIATLQTILPILVVTDNPKDAIFDIPVTFLVHDDPGWGARHVKLCLDSLSPWEYTLYLDADTRSRVSIAPLLHPLMVGWDMVITTSSNQGDACLKHLDDAERIGVFQKIASPLQLQAGVFSFAKNERTKALFAAWREEWRVFAKHDQGALLLALERCPLRLWLYGRDWNGGACIEHFFGRAR